MFLIVLLTGVSFFDCPAIIMSPTFAMTKSIIDPTDIFLMYFQQLHIANEVNNSSVIHTLLWKWNVFDYSMQRVSRNTEHLMT